MGGVKMIEQSWKNLPPVSIVVPAYNAQKTIRECLKALLALDYPHKEVLVVNDGSTDETADIIKRYPVKLVNQSNSGVSSARNIGLSMARGEIVAYVDSDTVVTKDWLTTLIKPFKNPDVGAVTGKTEFEKDERCTSWVRSLDIRIRNNKRKKYTQLANGPNCAFRKDVLLGVGGFKPEWFHAEDTTVSYEVCRVGKKIVYEPRALAHHVPEGDWRKFLHKRYRDARAFTRILVSHTMDATFKDDFVTWNMKIQPPLFALLILTLFAVVTGLFMGNFWPLIIWTGGVLLAILFNFPLSIAVAMESRRPSFLFKALALTVASGVCWGAGLLIGGVYNAKTILCSAIRRILQTSNLLNQAKYRIGL